MNEAKEVIKKLMGAYDIGQEAGPNSAIHAGREFLKNGASESARLELADKIIGHVLEFNLKDACIHARIYMRRHK